MFPHRRKDLSDRGRDQGCLPSQCIGRRASHFAGSAQWESAPATPAIHRASLQTSYSQINKAFAESNPNSTSKFAASTFGICPYPLIPLPVIPKPRRHSGLPDLLPFPREQLSFV